MRTLVAGGADPKMTMPNGATALMLAAGMGTSFEESRRGINVIDFGKVEPRKPGSRSCENRVRLEAPTSTRPIRPAIPRCMPRPPGDTIR